MYLLGTNCVPPVSWGERGQIQSLVALFAQLVSLYFPFKNKPRYFSIWLETTLTPHRVAASCCKLQIWFLGIGCRGKKRYNCIIWAFWNVNVSKKCARVYSSLKLFIQPRVLCIQGRGTLCQAPSLPLTCMLPSWVTLASFKSTASEAQ